MMMDVSARLIGIPFAAMLFCAACDDGAKPEGTGLSDSQPVLVEFDIGMDPANPTAGMMQAIANSRRVLLDKAADAGVEIRVSREYKILPQLAATVDGDALLFLLAQEEVLAIRPDRTVAARSQ